MYIYLGTYQPLSKSKQVLQRAKKNLVGTLSRTLSSSLLMDETLDSYQLCSWDCKLPANSINDIFSVLYRINSIQYYYNFVSCWFLSSSFFLPLATAILVQKHDAEMFLLPTCEGDIIIFYDLLFCDVQRALSDHVTRFIHTG